MIVLQDWMNRKLKEIAEKLPTLVHTEPASFSCGYNVGYKHAILDLEREIESGLRMRQSWCWCNDKFHERGETCL